MFVDQGLEVKADPLSLESLIAWLEKQPAHVPYCYLDNGYCLIAQYLIANGYKNPQVYPHYFTHDASLNIISYPYELNIVARTFRYELPNNGRTFGGALTRAREALARQSR